MHTAHTIGPSIVTADANKDAAAAVKFMSVVQLSEHAAHVRLLPALSNVCNAGNSFHCAAI